MPVRIKGRMTVASQVIAVKERSIAKGLKSEYNAAAKASWEATGEYFHDHLRDKRFTPEHAREAGYYARKGQNLTRGSKRFRRSYYGRKYYAKDKGGGFKRANPLEFTGETRRAVAAQPRLRPTRYGVSIPYSAARKFNFRNAKSQIRMSDEFRRITPSEVKKLAEVFDSELDQNWKS